MRLGSIFRYAQVVVVTLLVAMNPFGLAVASTVVEIQHCPAATEHHPQFGHASRQENACCSTTHCCPILPELGAIAQPGFEPKRHERMSADYRPLLLIRAIDPPPRSSAA
ncbi:hypothetical protein B5K08_26455 [Rhizobium leguminosarum bv. trifolii]|uniref:Uncharacterized protein n=1 Tax=Rhizobium leguminosarum bv. trifolii TaxID=386 RepID=A0A3E1BB33_RHILT|nr:hypothetical protein B5K08_26455 [Rhizobium leguminosarum bv. trifolii]RFB86140.1 hypothetical protein B5K10_25170 [Rhizobium leguminosarum bv. trifolii]RFB88745.1 hypothetical protein B5K11_25110 [Rhizobium leguminosarum bv. trifolii]